MARQRQRSRAGREMARERAKIEHEVSLPPTQVNDKRPTKNKRAERVEGGSARLRARVWRRDGAQWLGFEMREEGS